MCDRDHAMLTSGALREIVAEGGGVKTVKCEGCGIQFLVTYGGPSGFFSEVRELVGAR